MKSDLINGVEHPASFPAEQNRLGLVVAGSDAGQRDQLCKALQSITELRLEIHNREQAPGETGEIRSDRILCLFSVATSDYGIKRSLHGKTEANHR
jgi:hypothetical protein